MIKLYIKYISGFKTYTGSGIIGFRDGIGHGLVWVRVRDLRIIIELVWAWFIRDSGSWVEAPGV